VTRDLRPVGSYRPTPQLFARIAHLVQMERVAKEIEFTGNGDDAKILRGFLTYAQKGVPDCGHSMASTTEDPEDSELLDCEAVAKIFGVNQRTVRRWAEDLPRRFSGSTHVFTSDDVAELHAKHRRSA